MWAARIWIRALRKSLIWTKLARPGFWYHQHRVRSSCAWSRSAFGMSEPPFFSPPIPARAAGVAMERKVSPSVKRCMAAEAPAGCHATLPLPRRLCPPVPMARERSRGVKLSMSPCMFNASIRISTLRKMSGLCFLCGLPSNKSLFPPNAARSSERCFLTYCRINPE